MKDMAKKVSTKAKDYEILAFYPYPSTATEILSEYQEHFPEHGEKKLKRLYGELLEVLRKAGCGNLEDNKVSMKIRDIHDGETYYISFKDWYYRIGKGIYQESATEIVFDKSDDKEWKPKYTRNETVKHSW